MYKCKLSVIYFYCKLIAVNTRNYKNVSSARAIRFIICFITVGISFILPNVQREGFNVIIIRAN